MLRRTPLKRVPLPPRNAPIARSAPPRRSKPPRAVSVRQKTRLPSLRAAQREVAKRSAGWCEAEGCDRQAADYHHRMMRSAGGPDTAANLAHLCRPHHDRVHAHPNEGYESGLLLHSWDVVPR